MELLPPPESLVLVAMSVDEAARLLEAIDNVDWSVSVNPGILSHLWTILNEALINRQE